MQGIDGEMTVREVLRFCSPVQQMNLQYWAESFGVKLRDFHLGHIKTYESERLREASLQMVNAEVSTLLHLLDSVGVGDGIRKRYRKRSREFIRFQRAGHKDTNVKIEVVDSVT